MLGRKESEAEGDQPRLLTINQVVAINLMRARVMKGWTQEQAADVLGSMTGKKWTNATLSAAERSWQSGRTREFNASELVAFAITFNLPMTFFLVPPATEDRVILSTLATPDKAEVDGLPKDPGEWPTWGYMLPFHLLMYVLPLFDYPADAFDLIQHHMKGSGVTWTPGSGRFTREDATTSSIEPAELAVIVEGLTNVLVDLHKGRKVSHAEADEIFRLIWRDALSRPAKKPDKARPVQDPGGGAP